MSATTAPAPVLAVTDPPAAPRTRPALRLLGAVASGLLAYGAFPPLGGWPLAVPAVALLVLCCRGVGLRRAALLGLVHGLALFVPLVEWTAATAGPGALVALALLEAAFFAAMGPALALVTRAPGWPVTVALVWVLQEALRSRLPFGGFPWGRLAFSQADGVLLPLAAVAGAPLVSFAVALLGGVLAYAILALAPGARAAADLGGAGSAQPAVVGARARRLARPAVAVLGTVLLTVGTAALVPVPTSGPTTRVALVQGNVPRLGLDFNAQRAAVLNNHAAATRTLAADVRAGRAARPDLVIWPENASDLDPFTDPAAFATIDDVVRDLGVPVLVGAVLDGPGDKISNAGIVWDPSTGPGARYVKRHPVPFGEYIPFRTLVERVTDKVSLVPRDFAAGDRPGVLRVGPVTLGDVICFEVAYDDLVRDVVREGGRLLVVQTNNATFGRSAETTQQLAMGRLRAVEHGRAVLVAATSGISAVIAPDGSVTQSAPVFTRSVLQADVPLRDEQTLATRLGALPEAVLSLLALLAVQLVPLQTRRARA